jgi:hypothetical protein
LCLTTDISLTVILHRRTLEALEKWRVVDKN